MPSAKTPVERAVDMVRDTFSAPIARRPPQVAVAVTSVNPRLTLLEIAERIRRALHQNVVEIGELLLQAKQQVAHGEFQTWAERELGIKSRTAQNYMNAAEFVRGKSETVSHLPPALLYRLAAPSAPPELVEEVAISEQIDPADIEEKLDRHRDAKREKRAVERAALRAKCARGKQARPDRTEASIRRESQRREQKEASRAEELTPMVQKVIAAGLAPEIAAILDHWEKARTFHRLLQMEAA